MTDGLKDKVVIVTGAASGIGKATAERFAAEGARVVVCDINKEAGRQVAEKTHGLFVEADLSRREDCANLVRQAADVFGTVHVLVNNAGFQHIDPVEDFPEDTWDRMIAVMLTAPFLLIHYAWPHMKQQQWGRVINIDSIHGVVASPFKAGYISAKHGLLGLTRTTALEGGPHNITVNAICPAYVRTPLVEGQVEAQAQTRGISEDEVIRDVMLEPAAIKRLIEPEEVADMCVFLCGPTGATMSGAPLMMDLGWTAR